MFPRLYRLLSAIVLVLAHACASQPTATRSEATAASGARGIYGPPIEESTLKDLAEASEQVDLQTEGVRSDVIGPLLERLATAVAELEQSDRTAQHMRTLIDDLADADPSSAEYRTLTLRALRAAVATVSAFGSLCGNADVGEISARAGLALARVDPELPLTKQPDRLQAALRAAVDAFLLAGGRAPVFVAEEAAVPALGREEEAPPAATFDEHVHAMHALLPKLGEASWSDARQLVGELLFSYAGALETSGQRSAFEKQINEVRFQGQRVRRRDGPPFARAGWIVDAMLSALDALASVGPPDRNELVTPWIDRARAAALAIDPRGSLGFQRAAVQDALRSTSDAFFAVSQLRNM
jgi:hypothetical protein